jgi:hypothetical protein
MPTSRRLRSGFLWLGLVTIVVGAVAVYRELARAPNQTDRAPSGAIAVTPTPPATPRRAAEARPQPSVEPERAAAPPGRRDQVGDEEPVMARIRDVMRSNPDEALTLLDAADRAHPGDHFAEERAALRVDALVLARRIGVARDAAEEFLSRYPRSARALHIEMLTGVHPHPSEPEP